MSTKRHQFYVEFLGWMECRGVRGVKYVEPVIKEMRRRQRKMQDTPPKLTIQATRKEVKISQDIEDKKKRFIKKIKFPTIPGRDITYVYYAPHHQHQHQPQQQQQQQDDVVACIYLGYMPRTDRYVHVHVYRFDGPTTAATFYREMARVVEANAERIKRIEIDLANKGEIDDPRLTSSDGMSEPHTTGSGTSSAYSDDDPAANFSQDDIDADLQSLVDVQEFDNVTDELKYRLQIKKEPILLPPKDYDTISRAHGNIEQANRRRCLNLSIVGGQAAALAAQSSPDLGGVLRPRNASTESGVDLTSPMTDRDFLQQQAMVNKDVLNLSMNSEGFKSSTSSTPGTPPTGLVHPLKNAKSPPMSPITGGKFPGGVPPNLVRQNSYNSAYSDGSRQSQHSDNGDSFPDPNNFQIYKPPDSGDVPISHSIIEPNDIYAQPKKRHHNLSSSSMNMNMNSNNLNASMNNMHIGNNYTHNNNNNGMHPNMNKPMVSVSPRIDYPPADYHEDDIGDVKLRSPVQQQQQQRFRQPHLTRSMPPELIRSEMAIGSISPHAQRNIREMNNLGRTHSPTFVGGGPSSRPTSGHGNGGVFLNQSQSWRPMSGYNK